MRILVKKGLLVDPSMGAEREADILVDNGVVAEVGEDLECTPDRTINAAGMIVSPGLIDMHTHLREPGREDVETVETGLTAAIKGGFTTVCAMPNTEPPCDSEEGVDFLRKRMEQASLGRIVPVGTITKGREGRELAPMAELRTAGCPAVSDDGSGVADAALMRHALEYARMLGLLVISHCEDSALAGEGVMNEGYWSTALGMKPLPAAAETVMVDRDIRLAEMTGAALHIAHVSAAASVEAIRNAKNRGVRVTAEATPHHFTLTEAELAGYDTRFKVNPPLRTEEDRKSVIEGLKDGTIDVIATDHAPHPPQEKEKEFDHAPFGMIGLETALSLAVSELGDKNGFSWGDLIELLALRPSSILGLERGTLRKGAEADIAVIDPGKEWVVSAGTISTRSKNSPFTGRTMKASVRDVLVGGRIVMEEGAITADNAQVEGKAG